MRWYTSEKWALVCRLPHCGGTAANNWLLYADYHTVVVPQRQLTLVCWLPHCGYSIKYPDCHRYRIINRLNSKHQHGKKCNNNPCAWIIPRMCVGGQAKFKLCHRILTGRYAASQIALWEDSGSRLEPWTGDPEPEETDVVTLSL